MAFSRKVRTSTLLNQLSEQTNPFIGEGLDGSYQTELDAVYGPSSSVATTDNIVADMDSVADKTEIPAEEPLKIDTPESSSGEDEQSQAELEFTPYDGPSVQDDQLSVIPRYPELYGGIRPVIRRHLRNRGFAYLVKGLPKGKTVKNEDVEASILRTDCEGNDIEPICLRNKDNKHRYGIPYRAQVQIVEAKPSYIQIIFNQDSKSYVYELDPEAEWNPVPLSFLSLRGASGSDKRILRHYGNVVPPSVLSYLSTFVTGSTQPRTCHKKLIRTFQCDWVSMALSMATFERTLTPIQIAVVKEWEMSDLHIHLKKRCKERLIQYRDESSSDDDLTPVVMTTPIKAPIPPTGTLVPVTDSPVSTVSSQLAGANFEFTMCNRGLYLSSFTDHKRSVPTQLSKMIPIPRPKIPYDGDSDRESRELPAFNHFLEDGTRPNPQCYTGMGPKVTDRNPCGPEYLESSTDDINEYYTHLNKIMQLPVNHDDWERSPNSDIDFAEGSPAYRDILDIFKRWNRHDAKSETATTFRRHQSAKKSCWTIALLVSIVKNSAVPGQSESAYYLLKHCTNSTFDLNLYLNALGVTYNVPVSNAFAALTDLDEAFESGDMAIDFRDVHREAEVRRVAKRGYATGTLKNRIAAGKTDIQTIGLRRQRPPPSVVTVLSDEDKKKKIHNVVQAVKRIHEKIDTLISQGSYAVAKYMLRSHFIGPQVYNKIVRTYDWVDNATSAMQKGDIYWAAYCKVHNLQKIYYMAGFLNRYVPAYRGSLSWVRDLTGDGDVEANPGPISMNEMKQVSEAPSLDQLANKPPQFKMVLQHWAHHRLTDCFADKGMYYGDLAILTVPHYNVQYPNENVIEEAPIPLRETQLYPRSIPMAQADGGQLCQEDIWLEFDIREQNAGGNQFPGVRQMIGPGIEARYHPAGARAYYLDLAGAIMEPQPVDENGVVDRARLWPTHYGGQFVQIRVHRRRLWGDWYPMPIDVNDPIFNVIWNHWDHYQLGPNDTIPARIIRPGEYIHTFQSGAPVLFIVRDLYPDINVPLLQDSKMTTDVYFRIDQANTVISHRPEPLLFGYKKADVEMYILNFKGLDAKEKGEWAGPNRVRLDMTSFNMKLGLNMAWWSYGYVDSIRGVSIVSQTQVSTPWITTAQREPYACVLNQSPNPLENCGGHANPVFPFTSTDGLVGKVGSISFHLSSGTVPKGKAQIWIPRAWHSRCYMSTIALVLMCLAPYPLCNLGMIFRATDSLSGQTSEVFNNWTGGLVHIPGDLELHVVWPRNSPEQIGANAAVESWQGMAVFRPYSGPESWGETIAGTEYNVGGDAKHQVPRSYNLVEFLLSWLGALEERDFRNVVNYFSDKAIYGKSWHVMFDVLSVWATRTGILTTGDRNAMVPIGVADRENFLANDEEFVKSIHMFGNPVPRIDPGAHWNIYRPRDSDGRINDTSVEGVGAVLGGFAIGQSGTANHPSMLLGLDSATWVPMSLLAFRALGTSMDLTLAYLKITPELFAHRNDRVCVNSTLTEIMSDFFPTSRNRDPSQLDLFDIILCNTTNGGALFPTDNGMNMMRTLGRPRDFSGCIFSRDLDTRYPIIVNIKYPDVYFQFVSEMPILDWAPFVTMQSGRGSRGLTDSAEHLREYFCPRKIGPALDTRNMPVSRGMRDIAIFDGISAWNNRLFLISGWCDLYEYPSGQAIEGFLPQGHLVCLFPWCDDDITHTPAGLSNWFWSNTIFTPTMLWNNRHIAVLNVDDGNRARHLRRVQKGDTSQTAYTWMMEDIKPLMLTSDPCEKMNATTARIVSRFKKEHKVDEELAGKLPAPKAIIPEQGNAEGENVLVDA